MSSGWIGVDLDGTLAKYDGWKGPGIIGEPVPAMVRRVKAWIVEGREVRIFTARVSNPSRTATRASEVGVEMSAIHEWCRKHIGRPLAVTCEKDYAMQMLYDDRCVQVEPNTGRLIGVTEVV